jgi:hypothetical protein
MLRICLTLAAVLVLALAAPAVGQDVGVPAVPPAELPREGGQGDTRDNEAEAAPQAEAAQEESEDAGSVEGGASTEDDAAEGTAAQAADRNCPDFDFQEDAQDFFDDNGGSPDNNFDELDANGDGVACEDLPSRESDDDAGDDEGDDAAAPRGGVDTGLGGTAGERGLSVLGLVGLCLLAVCGALAFGRRRPSPGPISR